jgi:hypothetical protein
MKINLEICSDHSRMICDRNAILDRVIESL